MEYYVPAVPPPEPPPENVSNWTNATWYAYIGYAIPECICPENGTLSLPTPGIFETLVNWVHNKEYE